VSGTVLPNRFPVPPVYSSGSNLLIFLDRFNSVTKMFRCLAIIA